MIGYIFERDSYFNVVLIWGLRYVHWVSFVHCEFRKRELSWCPFGEAFLHLRVNSFPSNPSRYSIFVPPACVITDVRWGDCRRASFLEKLKRFEGFESDDQGVPWLSLSCGFPPSNGPSSQPLPHTIILNRDQVFPFSSSDWLFSS